VTLTELDRLRELKRRIKDQITRHKRHLAGKTTLKNLERL
jgi:hypothetical protein